MARISLNPPQTWLRWSAAPRADVAQPRAYLVRTVTHIALNRLVANPDKLGGLTAGRTLSW
jgi:hypothetical protein